MALTFPLAHDSVLRELYSICRGPLRLSAIIFILAALLSLTTHVFVRVSLKKFPDSFNLVLH